MDILRRESPVQRAPAPRQPRPGRGSQPGRAGSAPCPGRSAPRARSPGGRSRAAAALDETPVQASKGRTGRRSPAPVDLCRPWAPARAPSGAGAPMVEDCTHQGSGVDEVVAASQQIHHDRPRCSRCTPSEQCFLQSLTGSARGMDAALDPPAARGLGSGLPAPLPLRHRG